MTEYEKFTMASSTGKKAEAVASAIAIIKVRIIHVRLRHMRDFLIKIELNRKAIPQNTILTKPNNI